MAVDLDHSFATADDVERTYAGIVDLERVIPLVEGGRVTEKTGPDSVNAEILVSMGAMSMTFRGTVEIVERDDAGRRVVMSVKSKEEGGSGYANADITFTLAEGQGTLHTHAQITGKAASMGEGVVAGVLDALITDFTGKISTL
jgi:uncharacterized protein